MTRACSHAVRLPLPPNTIAAPLPGGRTHAARGRGFAAHAQPPAGRRDEPPAEPPRQAEITQSVRRSRRRGPGSRQSLVSVGTSCGGGDQWSSDVDLTLRQLHLDDLIEDGQNDADVMVHLLVQQHTQFGMSIKGRVVTSFSKICDSCSSPYCAKVQCSFLKPSETLKGAIQHCRQYILLENIQYAFDLQIDEQFNLTVLSSTRKGQSGMPDIGDSDPSVRLSVSD
ncbi:hypothetical protein GUJ93_ZPchr0014g46989 [Zizania palustris]|uniref:Uncharacterized protein n=1 Tax=Zizania palustris TaxID=103762 RepID=A0A8J5VSA5_ZIZPA|nr:hypothetical protein GUJ93_ZPchr0014g46989 [Zizania palustris]